MSVEKLRRPQFEHFPSSPADLKADRLEVFVIADPFVGRRTAMVSFLSTLHVLVRLNDVLQRSL